MQIITLYKYQRDDGGVTVSPNEPDCEYVKKYRIIADEGKLVTQDGINKFGVIDCDSTEGWYEVEAPEKAEEVIDDDGV